MSATLLKASKDEAVFVINIDAKTLEKALMEEYHKATSSKDKKSAPAFLSNEILLRQYPELEKIAGKALEKLVPSYYMSAIKELGLHPITFPKIMPKSTELGQPCVLEVRVQLEPEFKLKQYERLEATYTPVNVAEEDIIQQMASLRKQCGAENDDVKLLKKLHFNSIKGLTEEIRSSFTAMAQEKTHIHKKEAVMKQLLEANPFILPEEIVEQQIMIEINKIRRQMGMHAMENYMKSSGRTMDDLRKEVRPEAEITVKINLLLNAIVEKILAEVTEEDIKDAISKQSSLFMELTADYETCRKRIEEIPGALDQIKHSIRLEKAANYIVGKAILHESNPINIMDELPGYLK